MAGFKQPAYEVGRGGGIDMNGEAMWIIEKYLQLVRDHLDESIADDVIEEIRAYLIEAAEDLSEGDITVDSAKKVVAGFGAPSEVAREYTSSLPTDKMKFEKEPSEEVLIQIQQAQQTPVIEEIDSQEPQISEVSYFSTFTKAITLIVSWTVISWIPATILVPWWPRSITFSFPFLQFLVLFFAISFMLRKTKKRGIKLKDCTYPQWPGLQKLVTFPENSPLKPSDNTRMLDIMLTIFGTGFFAVSFLNSMTGYEYATFSIMIAIPATLVLALRSIVLIRELGGIDPARFVRQEYLLDAITIVFLNATISWEASPYQIPIPLGIFLWWYAFVFSINILYQLVVKGQDMWWEVIELPISVEPKTPEKPIESKAPEKRIDTSHLIAKTKKIAMKCLVRLSAIYIAMPLIGFVITIFSGVQVPTSYWQIYGSMLVVFDLIFWILAVVLCSGYFGARYYLIKSRGRTEIIRKRTRKEAFIDLIGTGIILITALVMLGFLFMRNIPDFINWLEGSAVLYKITTLSTLGCLIVFFYIGIVARVVADIINLIQRETKLSLELFNVSGNSLLLSTAFLFGLTISVHNFFYMLEFLLLYALFSSIIVSLQIVTTRIKLSSEKKIDEVDTEASIDIE